MEALPLKAEIFSQFLIFVEESEQAITDDHYESGMPDMSLHVFAATRFLAMCNLQIQEGDKEIEAIQPMIVAIMFDLIDFLEKNESLFESQYLESKRLGEDFPWLIFPYVKYLNKVLYYKEYENNPS